MPNHITNNILLKDDLNDILNKILPDGFELP